MVTKKIVIDVSFLFDQYATRGIGIYGKEVVRRLILNYVLKQSEIIVYLIGFLDFEQNLVNLGFTPTEKEIILNCNLVHFFSLGKVKYSGIKNLLLWRSKYLPILNEVSPDLYFAVHFERCLPTVPFINRNLQKIPYTFVTVHDLIPMYTNSFSSKSFLHNMIKGLFYKFLLRGVVNADLVFCPSYYVKQQVMNVLKIDQEKIKVVYNGVSEQFFISKYTTTKDEVISVLRKYNLVGEKFFIYDSGLEKSKGVDKMLEVLKLIFSKNLIDIPKKIVIIGGSLSEGIGDAIQPQDKLGEIFLNKARNLGILNNIIATGRISEYELRILLFSAFAHIYLSQNEGFGLPTIQAMAAEIPAIAYNGSCLPEITSGGALLVNLNNLEDTVNQIIHFLQNDDLREKYRQKGLEIAKKYNWDNTAYNIWNSMKDILE
ncbi:MAG: glycosyltransferase family 4 protein [Candidatus Dojkabacteria bacterium]|nr:glycosyltransferase family 4 protein [Candidatus Dojkabacteria bacterium]